MSFQYSAPLPFIDFGGSGQTIHFAHANGYPPSCYLPLIKLLQNNFHVISMLQRPLWPDSNPNELDDWRPLTFDLIEFLDQHSFNQPIVIGHSMGGIASLRAAILEPDRFKALVLIDPVLFSPFHIIARKMIWSMDTVYRHHPLIKATKYRRRKFADLNSIFTSFRQKSIFRYLNDESLWAYVKGITVPDPDKGYSLAYSPEWEMRIYATGIWNDLDIWRDISRITIPVLVIRGKETNTFLPHAANQLLKRLPATKLVTIEKATHLVPLEHPEKVNRTIVNFLQETL
jgi:pimeloyl-ACP methyl ester carboxylesterase